MSFSVAVDQDLCMSSGRCVAEAPGAFVFDDDELAVAVAGQPGIPDDELLAIARGCPSGAISVQDAGGARIV